MAHLMLVEARNFDETEWFSPVGLLELARQWAESCEAADRWRVYELCKQHLTGSPLSPDTYERTLAAIVNYLEI